jgi:chromodomain-helicase-DNA-binding protein 7
MTHRLTHLAAGIRWLYFSAQNRAILNGLWQPEDRSKVIYEISHVGVPLSADGSYEWARFRENCGITDKTDEQTKNFVHALLDDSDDNSTDSDWSADTQRQVREQLDSLTQLRRLFQKYSDEEMRRYFMFLPRRLLGVSGWTNEKEFLFFREICSRGWSVSGEILTMAEFCGVFEGEPPSCIIDDLRTLRRLDFILNFIDQTPLETLIQIGRQKPKVKPGPACRIPAIAFDAAGSPVLPLRFAHNAYLIDLGHIVTDRTGFHTKAYIYPAGFKSSRLYTSILDPTQKVRYTSEILDTGEAKPIFRVTMDGVPEICFSGPSPSSPWSAIAGTVLGRPQYNAYSGPDFFGLSFPVVCYLIQRMEGADKCMYYEMRQFE